MKAPFSTLRAACRRLRRRLAVWALRTRLQSPEGDVFCALEGAQCTAWPQPTKRG
jgi:hypothetical protein